MELEFPKYQFNISLQAIYFSEILLENDIHVPCPTCSLYSRLSAGTDFLVCYADTGPALTYWKLLDLSPDRNETTNIPYEGGG